MKTHHVVLLGSLLANLACTSRKESSGPLGREERSEKAPIAAAIDRQGIGLNLGSLDFRPEECGDPMTCPIIGQALSHAQILGARWIRLEISRGRDAAYWDGVIARFEGANISVLGAFNNTLWTGGSRDPDVCDDYYATDFGSRLVTEWLPIATSYLDTLRGRVRDWEIWNEANNVGTTDLCPANYAYLLTEAAIQWNDMRGWGVAIGPSMLNYGSSTSGSDYLDHLFNNTDKVAFYRSGHGGNPPWVRVYDHPYPCHDTFCGVQGEPPSIFLQHQADTIRAAQPAPIWFSELGFQASDDQANNLIASYDVALHRNLAEKVFWFSLTDCAGQGPYGLLNGCPFDSPPRPSYWSFQSLSTNSLDCHSMMACKMTRAGSGCESPSMECPAVRFALGWAQTLHFHTNGYDATQCAGNVIYIADNDISFPFGSEWIVYVQLNFCPAAQYSADYTVGACNLLCGNYGCQNPLPDCDAFGAELVPAIGSSPN